MTTRRLAAKGRQRMEIDMTEAADAVSRIGAGELGLTDSTLDPSLALGDIEVDSLVGLEIATAIEKSLELRLSAVDLTSGTSIDQITAMVIERHQSGRQR